MKQEHKYLTKPESLKIALVILYADIFLQIVRGIFAFNESLKIAQGAGMPSSTMFISMLFSYGFNVFIIFMISKRKKWAWIIELILTVYGLVGFLILLATKSSFLFSTGSSDLFLSVLSHMAHIVAGSLLIKKDSRNWFIAK